MENVKAQGGEGKEWDKCHQTFGLFYSLAEEDSSTFKNKKKKEPIHILCYLVFN